MYRVNLSRIRNSFGERPITGTAEIHHLRKVAIPICISRRIGETTLRSWVPTRWRSLYRVICGYVRVYKYPLYVPRRALTQPHSASIAHAARSPYVEAYRTTRSPLGRCRALTHVSQRRYTRTARL